MQYLASYHYLAAGLTLSVLAAFTFVVLRRQWPILLLSGLLAVPPAFFSCEFIPAYWNPRVLFHYITSLEDILFSVSVGVISMFIALLPYANQVKCQIDYRPMAKRFVLTFSLLISLWVVFRTALPEIFFVMPLALALIVALGIVLTIARRDLLMFAVRGGFSFTAFYLCILLVIKILQPTFFNSWNPAAQFPISAYGIPTYELLWALVYGCVWPLYIAFVCDLQIMQESKTVYGPEQASPHTFPNSR